MSRSLARAYDDLEDAVATADLVKAHACEDAVWESALVHIARHSTDKDARKWARKALTTRKLEFDRWYGWPGTG